MNGLYVIEHGADFSEVDDALYNAMDFQKASERKEFAEFLMESYPKMIKSGTDALPTAIEKGDIDCVKLLIENGVNVNKSGR